jgi:dynein heavy chain 1
VRVDTGAVRASVGNKYDFWHRDLLGEFGTRVGKATAELFEETAKLRQELEGRSVAHDSAEVRSCVLQGFVAYSSKKGAVEFVMQLQEVQRKLPGWQEQLSVAARSHDTLRKHRWTSPPDWTPLEMAEAEWSAFSELVKRRQAALALRLPELTQDILKETQSAEQSAAQVCVA